jgi:hypothetical protein
LGYDEDNPKIKKIRFQHQNAKCPPASQAKALRAGNLKCKNYFEFCLPAEASAQAGITF